MDKDAQGGVKDGQWYSIVKQNCEGWSKNVKGVGCSSGVHVYFKYATIMLPEYF